MTEDAVPVWLQWLASLGVGITAIGGSLIWLGRIVLLPGIKAELEELLAEKFAEAKNEVVQRHEDNQKDIRRVEASLAESKEDRKRLHDDLVSVKSDVEYLRGKTSGLFKKS